MSEHRSAREAVASFGGRLVRTVDVRRSETQRALPRVRIEIGRSFGAGGAHLATAVLALVGVALLRPPPLIWLAAIVAAAIMAVRPAAGSAALFGAALGIGLAYEPQDLLSARPFVLLLLIPAMVMLGALTQPLPRHARVEWAALAPAARRLAVLQVGAQSLALAVALASERDIQATGIAVLGAVGCAGAAWLLRGALRGVVDEQTRRDPADE